ncbi:hypothetical protein, partial [Clostridium perfringens]
MNALIFSVTGPVIGGAIFFTLISAKDSMSNLVVAPLTYLFIVPIAVPVAYFMCGLAPALTGTFVAIATIWLTFSRYLY